MMVNRPCTVSKVRRLKAEAQAVSVGEKNISEYCDLSVADALRWIEALRLSEREETIAVQIRKEIRERLGFRVDVGLEYLTPNRVTPPLSGAEAQRSRPSTPTGAPGAG